MKPLKVSANIYKELLEYIAGNSIDDIKSVLLNGHKRRMESGGWKGYASFNDLSVEQMEYALTHGFEIEGKSDGNEFVTDNTSEHKEKEIKKCIKSLHDKGWTNEYILSKIKSGVMWNVHFDVMNNSTYLEVSEIMKSVYEDEEVLEKCIESLYAKIDVALDTNDKKWFMELTNKLKEVKGDLK